MEDFDAVVIGAGVAGCTMARLLAEKGKRVLVFEKTKRIGGQAADDYIDGRLTQLFGIHVLYGDSMEVKEFFERFAELQECKMISKCNIHGKVIDLPINFKTFEQYFDKETADKIKKELKTEFRDKKVSYSDIKNAGLECQTEIDDLLHFVYEEYSDKQWQEDAKSVSVIDRVKIIIGYAENYIDATYYYVPKDGFTKMFQKMVDHENIRIVLGEDGTKYVRTDDKKVSVFGKKVPVINTTRIDKFFQYKYDSLKYRSLDFEYKNVEDSLGCCAMHFPVNYDYIRVSDTGFLYGRDNQHNRVYEYPKLLERHDYKTYYTVSTSLYKERAATYGIWSLGYDRIYQIGRAAEYRHYTMFELVENCIKLAGEIK